MRLFFIFFVFYFFFEIFFTPMSGSSSLLPGRPAFEKTALPPPSLKAQFQQDIMAYPFSFFAFVSFPTPPFDAPPPSHSSLSERAFGISSKPFAPQRLSLLIC